MIRILTGLCAIIFCVLSLSNIAQAKNYSGFVKLENSKFDEIDVSGGAEINNVECQSLVVNGYLQFTKAMVAESVEVNGSAQGDNMKCTNLIVKGSLDAKNLKAEQAVIHGSMNVEKAVIPNNTQVLGAINATNSTFGNIEVSGTESTLLDSSAKNILVKNDKNKLPKLILKGNTHITGNVIFESGNGEIYMDPKSSISGKITGARVIKH